VELQLESANIEDADWFWTKGKEVQQLEFLSDWNRLDNV